MTKLEYIEILKWITARYPQAAKWPNETISAYFDDLEKFRAKDVFKAVKVLHEGGRNFAPTSSHIIKILKDWGTIPENALPAPAIFPVDKDEKPVTSKQYAKMNGFKTIREMIYGKKKKRKSKK